MSTKQTIEQVVIGSGSDIARELITSFGTERSLSIGRSESSNAAIHLQNDYSEAAIAHSCEELLHLPLKLKRIIICNGRLAPEGAQPEKRLEQVNRAQLQQTCDSNAVIPALWLSNLMPLVKAQGQALQIVVFSARVGSIGDNRSGGWYSYRASKAMLNMLVKTMAIEYQRRAPLAQIILLHPGTVATKLSAKFRSSDAAGVHSTQQFAEHFQQVCAHAAKLGGLQYLDWQAKPIEW